MHTTEGSRNPLVRVALAWNRFWFHPADPTTLGLIRLCVGILVFYAHVAYSYDLHEFFGKDAWMSLREANLQRREVPRSDPPTGWEQPQALPSLSPVKSVREPALKYVRDFPDDPADRKRVLAILELPRLPEKVKDLPADPAARAQLAMLLRLKGVPDNPEEPVSIDWGRPVPPAVVVQSPETRAAVATLVKKLPEDRAERGPIIDYLIEWNTDPRGVIQGAPVWSVWFHVTEPGWMVFVHCLILLAMFCFAIGFCTRVTSVVTWLGALSYIHRSPNTFYGADAMMLVSLLYLMIGPSGAALSADRLIARWWAERRARREGRPLAGVAPPAPSISANFALRLFQVQFCIIYLAAGTSKLLGGRWWNGQALYYTVANYGFSPVRFEAFQAMLTWLCQHRWLWELVVSGGTWFTVALEIALPLLVWNRKLRLPLVACSVLLHTAIALFMGLVVFSLMMGTMVVSFVPGETLRGLWRRPLPATEGEAEETPEKPKGKARHGSRRRDAG